MRHPDRGGSGASSRAARPVLGDAARTSDILVCGSMSYSLIASISIGVLLKLRDDIAEALARRAAQLREELSRLGGTVKKKKRSSLKGRKVAVKYRDKSGNTWAGRGAQPRWLREKLKARAKLEDFAVRKTAASRKASPKKRRRAKR